MTQEPPLHAFLQAAPGDPETVAAALEEARARTLHLASGFSPQALATPAAEYLSPPVWDLGHIANFEERWLVQTLGARSEMRPGCNDTYNAFRHPRQERPTLDLLDRQEVRAYMDQVRDEVLRILHEGAADGVDARLLDGLFVYWMLVLHEHQHNETLLQSAQMRGASRPQDSADASGSAAPVREAGALDYCLPSVRRLPDPDPHTSAQAWLPVPGGPFAMGWPTGPGAYDNEAPVHQRAVEAFEIRRYPVTVGEYLAFVEADGYADDRWWSKRGCEWLAAGTEADPHDAPMYWRRTDTGWVRDAPGCTANVSDYPDIILSHVTHFEAEAYAAWAARQPGLAGARLPTEEEWEKAARCDPATGAVVGRNPWGDAPASTDLANIDQLSFAPSRVGAFPAGASPVGCQHMIGDVWEWTGTGFEPYPGFEAFPYDEYSKVFFGGDYRVLRGGSWATRAACATGSFRNWDHPYRRQIFSGIRLARDA